MVKNDTNKNFYYNGESFLIWGLGNEIKSYVREAFDTSSLLDDKKYLITYVPKDKPFDGKSIKAFDDKVIIIESIKEINNEDLIVRQEVNGLLNMYNPPKDTFLSRNKHLGVSPLGGDYIAYEPIGRIQRYQVTQEDKDSFLKYNFLASWGEEMNIGVNDYLAKPLGVDEIYTVNYDAFDSTYELDKEAIASEAVREVPASVPEGEQGKFLITFDDLIKKLEGLGAKGTSKFYLKNGQVFMYNDGQPKGIAIGTPAIGGGSRGSSRKNGLAQIISSIKSGRHLKKTKSQHRSRRTGRQSLKRTK